MCAVRVLGVSGSLGSAGISAAAGAMIFLSCAKSMRGDLPDDQAIPAENLVGGQATLEHCIMRKYENFFTSLAPM